jgi:IS6 family transposase
LRERGVIVDHTPIYRWVQRYAPELEKRCRPHLKPTNDSDRVDGTCVKVKSQWQYVYRAIDSGGSTIDFLLYPKRDAKAAKQFFPQGIEGSPSRCTAGD